MKNPEQNPVASTLDSVRETGKESGLTGGPNPDEPGHDGGPGNATDLGETHYSPEMGSIVVERLPDQDER